MGSAKPGPDEVLDAWVADAPQHELELWADRLRAALVRFDEALISTIHGFCQRMLRRNAFESGSSFGADVVAQVPDVAEDVAVDFWTRLVYGADPTFLPAVKAAGMTVAKLRKLAQRAADLDLEVVPPRPPAAPPNAPLPDVSRWVAALADLQRLWDVDAVPALFADKSVIVQSKRAGYESFPPGRTRGKAWDVANRLKKKPPLAPTDVLHAAFAYFAPGRIRSATWEGKVPPSSPALAALDAFVLEHDRIQPAVAAVLQGAKHDLVDELRSELPRRARALNVRTYHDLLVDLRDGLRRGGEDGPLAQAIRSRYDVALIDEFQDTDPVQWEIFSTVFRDRLRLIGDPKQAIYSFRGADVFTYERAKGTADHTDTLKVNFRTDEPLHKAILTLFRRDQAFGAAQPVHPDVEARFIASRLVNDRRPPMVFRFLPRQGARLDQWGNLLAKGWLRQQLPGVVAGDIARELGRGVRIREDGIDRPLTARDCAVLVRTNPEAAAMQQALRARGIPSTIKSTASVFDSDEAKALTDILEAALEPTSAGAVRRALASVLMGRTADDLLAMESDAARFEAEVSPFHVWRTVWLAQGFAPMFRQLIEQDGMTTRLLARDQGERAVTNLEHLGELLTQAERERSLGPSGLVAWLRQGGTGTEEGATDLRMESDDEAVQVVTMHSAKGLEWPLVWCPSLYYSLAFMSLDKDHLEFHDPDDDYRAKLDIGSGAFDDHLKQRKRELFQEDLRLVYVAITRARHRCVVYWGACDKQAALGYLLHGIALDRWAFGGAGKALTNDEVIVADLRALALDGGMAVEPVDWSTISGGARWTPPRVGDAVLETRSITRRRAPDDWWRRSSFTGLTRGGLDVRDVGDTAAEPDGAAPTPTRAPHPLDDEPVTLAEFEAGARAGNFLHSVFELHDFALPDALGNLVERQLESHGMDPADADLVSSGVQQALDTPLRSGDGLRLADLTRAHRLDEMEFTVPSHGGFDATGDVLTAKALREAFAAGGGPGLPTGWAERVGRLAFLPLRGFLTGAIDLVFEHEGRYYLADYKSNRLGGTYADYASDRLPAHMSHANYILQYHLYSLALQRYLDWRLPDYSYERHFGGVYYLFLRGMHPDLGPSHGVFFDRPTEALIGRLEQAVCGGPR